MEKKELIYKATRSYTESGVTYRVNVIAKLADECKNGHSDFSVTAEVYSIKGPERPRLECRGCCHEEVAKAFPELKPIISLHLSNYLGQPLCAVENSMYFLKESAQKGADYMRITLEKAESLRTIALLDDKKFFTYQLYALGIVDAWKAEAGAAIKLLEDLTGDTWVNPYESPKYVLQPLSASDQSEIESRIKSGYYDPAAISERYLKAEADKAAALRADFIKGYEDKINKISKEKNVMLYLFDTFGARVAHNAIYYDSGKIGLNWRSYGKGLTPEEVKGVQKYFDYSRFPYVTSIEDQNK